MSDTPDVIPVAKLTLDGVCPLITDISTPEGWRAVYDTMGLDWSDPYVPVKDAVEGWRIELTAMPRDEYEALPEHGGW